MENQYILAIDAGTTGITIVVIDHQGQICHREYSEFTQYYPHSGWVEHDADEIWQTTLKLIRLVFARYPARKIAGLGITNQRETTILWDKQSGKPIHKAIVWQCRRTMEYCNQLTSLGYSNIVKNKTGLVIDPVDLNSFSKALSDLCADDLLVKKISRDTYDWAHKEAKKRAKINKEFKW